MQAKPREAKDVTGYAILDLGFRVFCRAKFVN